MNCVNTHRQETMISVRIMQTNYITSHRINWKSYGNTKKHVELERVAGVEEAVNSWKEAAKETSYLEKAIAYRKRRPPEHTGNKWVANEFGQNEISNLVYVMVTELVVWTNIKQKAKRAVPPKCTAKWYVCTNVHSVYQSNRFTIAGQNKVQQCGRRTFSVRCR